MKGGILGVVAAGLVAAACSQGGNEHPPRPDPVVTEIDVTAGPRSGGNRVVITGEYLGPDPFVTIGLANVEEILLSTDTRIELTVPPGNVGPANVSVIRADGGRTTLLDAYFYLPLDPVWLEAQWFDGAPDMGSANPVALPAGGTVEGLQIELARGSAGSITGLVTDPDGNPAADVIVWARRPDGRVLPVATVSGLDGTFHLRGLPDGDWQVYTQTDPRTGWANVLHPGVVDLASAALVAVSADTETGGVTLPLQAGATLQGTVNGASGAIEGASVFASMIGNSFAFASTQTDASGAYTLTSVAGGDYLMLAFGNVVGHATEYYDGVYTSADATPVAATAGETSVVDFELAPGAVVGGLILEDTSLTALGSVLVVAEEITTGAVLSANTDAAGAFTIGPLPPGSWRIAAPDLGQYYNNVPITDPGNATPVVVAAGDTVSGINFVGARGWQVPCPDPGTTGAIAGVVESQAAAPLPGARVEVIDVGTDTLFARPATVRTDGTYLLDCIPPGDYRVRATDANSTFVRQFFDGVEDEGGATSVTVTAAATTSPVDFALATGGTLSGRVTDAQTHQPVAGVILRATHAATSLTGTAVSGADGNWTLNRLSSGGLPAGDYLIEARDHVESEFNAYTHY